MIKMLFSDLDGTLLYQEGDHSADVNFENTEAIKKLEQSGVKFGVATSRSHLFLEKKCHVNIHLIQLPSMGILSIVQENVWMW